MKLLASLSLFGLLAAQTSFARIQTVTVTVNDAALAPSQLTYREQTTKKWLPGCMHYDVLQGTGWFPATFYFNSTPSQQAEAVYLFQVPGPSALSRYCAAKTDNVANSLSLEYKNEAGETIAYGGLNYRIEAKGKNVVESQCQWQQGEEGNPSSINCQELVISDAENIRIQLILNK